MKSEYWEKFLSHNRHVLQFEEIILELLKDEPDWGIVCKLLMEIFEDLNQFITSLYCVEISKFGIALVVYADDEASWELPEVIRDFLVFDLAMLYLFPSRYAAELPMELLVSSRELVETYKPDINYPSRREMIFELAEKKMSVKSISDELGINENLVEKSMILSEHIKGKTPSHTLWSRDEYV
ncbi:hypothetical protein H8E65_02845 [Candidatus Bathyarchaeota archaeon]|nr:hypothetical protein [Candidatus Bathyarchaeota archaeon]